MEQLAGRYEPSRPKCRSGRFRIRETETMSRSSVSCQSTRTVPLLYRPHSFDHKRTSDHKNHMRLYQSGIGEIERSQQLMVRFLRYCLAQIRGSSLISHRWRLRTHLSPPRAGDPTPIDPKSCGTTGPQPTAVDFRGAGRLWRFAPPSTACRQVGPEPRLPQCGERIPETGTVDA